MPTILRETYPIAKKEHRCELGVNRIKDLEIGDLFSLHKNGAIYEFLGYCPIENLPTAYNRSKYEVVYFEDKDKDKKVLLVRRYS